MFSILREVTTLKYGVNTYIYVDFEKSIKKTLLISLGDSSMKSVYNLCFLYLFSFKLPFQQYFSYEMV